MTARRPIRCDCCKPPGVKIGEVDEQGRIHFEKRTRGVLHHVVLLVNGVPIALETKQEDNHTQEVTSP